MKNNILEVRGLKKLFFFKTEFMKDVFKVSFLSPW